MKIRMGLAERMQWTLTVMALDDCMSPLTFVVDYVDEKKRIEAGLLEYSGKLIWWQETVDLIARLLISDIIQMVNVENNECALILVKRDMANHNPYDEKDYGEWFDQQLYASPLCRELLDKHKVASWDASFSPSLIEEIESLFAQAGVPMGGPPLIPIRQA